MTNEEMQQILSEMLVRQNQFERLTENRMQFILDQQADMAVKQAEFEVSTNKKIEFILNQQAKINTNVQLLTEIALTSALDSDHIKQEIREIKNRLDKAS